MNKTDCKQCAALQKRLDAAEEKAWDMESAMIRAHNRATRAESKYDGLVGQLSEFQANKMEAIRRAEEAEAAWENEVNAHASTRARAEAAEARAELLERGK
jgi:predicted  nucleic acid-binding Zn-ribbon protein